MNQDARIEIATRIAAAQTAAGRAARVWERDAHVRVYVTRDLSRRSQDIGYIEVLADGERNYNGLQRNKAGIRDYTETALSA